MEESNVSDTVQSAENTTAAACSNNNYLNALPKSTLPELNKVSPEIRFGRKAVTQVFYVRCKDLEKFGADESLRICQQIMKKTGTHIEILSGKNQCLKFLVKGKYHKVLQARAQIFMQIPTQANRQISIPKDHHRKKIDCLKDLAKQTATKINVPNINKESDTITISETKEEFENTEHEIMSDEQSMKTFERVNIPKIYHTFIIRLFNENLHKLVNETGAEINSPPETVDRNEITVTEEKDSVFMEKSKIEDIFKEIGKKWLTVNVEESKSKYYIIGQPDSGIQEILQATGVDTVPLRRPQVQISIPMPNENSDIVKIHGPTAEIKKTANVLLKIVKELEESSFSAEVPIFKKFHAFIIGKGGANMKKIQDETETKIDLPSEGDKNEVILITGKKTNVQEARERIQKIQNELVYIASEDVHISLKYFKSLIGNGDKLRSLTMEECGGASTKFPPPESNSDKVIISCLKDIEKAKEQLLELANELQSTLFISEVYAKQHYHKSLIGKNGASIQKIRDRTGALIIFPENNDENKEVITIIGKEENVKVAKEQLEALIEDIDKVIEEEMLIDPLFHKHFVSKRYEVIHRIEEECGGVSISFARSADDSDRVTLKGTQDNIEAAKRRIAEIVSDLQAQVTVDCVIPQLHYRTIMDSRDDFNVKSVSSKFDMFPVHDATEAVAGMDNVNDKVVRQGDIIQIIVCKENPEDTKQDPINLIPMTEEIIVPFNFHRLLIGRKGSNIHELMDKYEVHLELSPAARKLDIIKIHGIPSKIAKAKIALLDQVRDLDAQVTIDCVIPQMHHRTIMGSRHGIKVQGKFDVQIKYPDRDATDAVQGVDNGTDEEIRQCDIIRITGRKDKAEAAKETLISLIPITEEINIPFDFHRIIIRQKGRIVRKFIGRYEVHVEISAPKEKLNIIKITGTSSNVAEAKGVLFDQIKNLVTIDCAIPQRYHSSMGSGRSVKVQCVSSEFDVPNESLDRDTTETAEVLFNDTDEVVKQCVQITGRKENAEAAKLAFIDLIPISEEIIVRFDLHRLIMEQKRKQVSKICSKYYIHIKFSPPTKKLDIIEIIGTPSNVAKAKKALLDLVKNVAAYQKEYELRSFEIKIDIDPKYHQKIIGRRRAGINKIRFHFNVNVSFDREKITIKGYEANAKAARDEIFKIVNDVKEHASETLIKSKIDVGPKYPKFRKRHGTVNKKMRIDFNANTTIPRRKVQNDSHKIANQGCEANEKAAHNKMIKIVDNIEEGVCSSSVKDLEAQVTNDCVIPQRHFRTVMGPVVPKVQDLAGEYDVQIDIPDRDANKEAEGLDYGTTDETLRQCAESAKQAPIDLIPIIEQINIPFNLQGLITERKSGAVFDIMRRYDVHIMLPPLAKKLDIIEISGMPSKVAEAKEALFDQMKNLESDHDLLPFEIKMDIAREYYLQIFGKHRVDAILKKMSNYFDVNAKISDRKGYYGSHPITIQGHEANVKAARDEIIKICNERSQEMIRLMVKYIHNIMKKYEVNIKFPNPNEENLNSVIVTSCE